jgi:predicted phosphodiesterase
LRYGVIADIHGNLPALQTALAALRKEGVDSFVCLGDLVGYGPHPNQVVETVGEREIPCVLGNHDEVVATGRGLDRVNELARTTLMWTLEAISPSTRDFLASLPITREMDGGVLLSHGSLDDPWTYVRRTSDVETQLDRLGDYGSATTLLFGHTHRQFVLSAGHGASATSEGILARSSREVVLAPVAAVNPGAVGQSREWRRLARFALLDLAARHTRLFATPYPHAETVADLRRAGLPEEACHIRPPFKKVLRQAARDYDDRKERD